MNHRILIAFLGILMVTSGCVNSLSENNGPSEDSSPSETDIDRTIEISGGSYYFEPNDIQVEQGETVEFVLKNEGGFHDMIIPELDVGTERINGGETDSFTVTFTGAGEYEFICSVGTHAQQGMTGTITVS